MTATSSRALPSRSTFGETTSRAPARIASLEGPTASARRHTPLMRLPGARVAVLTTSDAACQSITDLLADELTTVAGYGCIDELIRAERPDVVVVSREMLCAGAQVLRRLRQRWLTCTLIVTGAANQREAAQLLDIGADNVMVADDELLAPRLRAAARRARTINRDLRTTIGDITYDRESRRIWCAGQEIQLTRTEEALLDCLFWYAPDPASIAQLTAFAWGRSESVERRNLVHVYVGYLRKKLRGSRQVVIHTHRGVGYGFAERRAAFADVDRSCHHTDSPLQTTGA